MRSNFQQFYVKPENVRSDHFVIEGDEFKHATKVLRKQPGDVLTAVDGKGRLYSGVILNVEKNQLSVSLQDVADNVGEPGLKLTLAHAVPKGSHFDWVVEKGTEIGVSAFLPINTRRSIAHPESRLTRYQLKALTAMKQCGRSCWPIVYEPVAFAELFKRPAYDKIFIAHEQFASQNSLEHHDLRNVSQVLVCIGPEGGFTDDEFELALNSGSVPLGLGPRRLRSETAALVACMRILSWAGELGI